MGWFSSTPSPDAKPVLQPTAQPTTPTPTSPPQLLQPEPESSLPSQPDILPPSQPKPHDPDADFHSAFPHLAPSSSPPSQPSASSNLNEAQDAAPTDYTYPSTMSCRAAFDSAFYCSSLGGHFNDIYRYGQLRSCSEHWADWRFCMGLKSKGKEAAEEAVRDRYREKEEKVRDGRSSEDIWARRGPGEMVENPFSKAGE